MLVVHGRSRTLRFLPLCGGLDRELDARGADAQQAALGVRDELRRLAAQRAGERCGRRVAERQVAGAGEDAQAQKTGSGSGRPPATSTAWIGPFA